MKAVNVFSKVRLKYKLKKLSETYNLVGFCWKISYRIQDVDTANKVGFIIRTIKIYLVTINYKLSSELLG